MYGVNPAHQVIAKDKSRYRRVAVQRWGMFGAAMIVAAPAHAQIELRCYKGPEQVAKLKAELKAADQLPVIIGNRTGGNWNVNLFTSDAEGRIGYNIEGNERFGSGKESSTLCVASKYRSIVINDVTKPGIPPWALVGGGIHDESVRTGERNGYRIAMGAVALVPDGKGGERDGPLVIIDFSPTDSKRLGGMTITDGRGVRKTLVAMIDTQYGPRARDLMQRSTARR